MVTPATHTVSGIPANEFACVAKANALFKL